jgi:hypothetical protein
MLGTAVVFACLVLLRADDSEQGPLAPRWKQHDIRRPRPPVVEPADTSVAVRPPKDAITLFDGSNLDAWKSASGGPAKWKVGDGYFEVAPGTGSIVSKERFGDMQLHVEWASPKPPGGVGQDRGNSGIFLMDQFEIQVLDSYKADTYADGQAGAIYGQFPPMANASRPPGEWQSYDIAFRRPRFDSAGKLVAPARITVFLNGILVQNNEEPVGPTSWLKELPYTDSGDAGPISLQDHSHPVRFRNIWVRRLSERPAPTPEALARPKIVTVPTALLDEYAGQYLLSPERGGTKATIRREDNHLVISFPFRTRPLVLEPISETVFDMPFTYGKFTFRKDDQGKVTSVLFQIGDSERDMKRVTP